jgi:peptidyl-prolyl cis-trans isomerase C
MESVAVKHILVKEKYEAEDLLKKLAEGVTFEELAKKHSQCPSSQKGGDLGTFGRGRMVPAFDKASFELGVGETSEPVQTQFGYHLIQRYK